MRGAHVERVPGRLVIGERERPAEILHERDEPFAARRVFVVADRRKDGERAQERTGDVEEALPITLVAVPIDEVAGEDGEVGLLVGERLVQRDVDVVAGADSQ